MTKCRLEEEVGQACFFLSHAVTFSYMTMKDQSNLSKMQSSLKTSTSRLWSHVADRLKEANAQAPAVAVYLL